MSELGVECVRWINRIEQMENQYKCVVELLGLGKVEVLVESGRFIAGKLGSDNHLLVPETAVMGADVANVGEVLQEAGDDDWGELVGFGDFLLYGG